MKECFKKAMLEDNLNIAFLRQGRLILMLLPMISLACNSTRNKKNVLVPAIPKLMRGHCGPLSIDQLQ